MTLNNHAIVQRINHRLSEITIQCASDPDNHHQHLADFAMYVNTVMAQRDDTDVSDARCGNCGDYLFNPNVGDEV